MTIATDLRAAADYLRTYGWQRGESGRDGGPRCAFGAILSVSGSVEAVDFVEREVLQNTGLSGFNDRDCKTKNDAIAILEIAADLATPSPEAT